MSPTRPRKRSRSPSPSQPSKRLKTLPPTIPIKLLILSDTHDTIPVLPPSNVLLHCGDLTDDGSPISLRTALLALSRSPAELKLLIPGNHDLSLDPAYYTHSGGPAAHCCSAAALVSRAASSEASRNGITVLSEGTHAFTLKSGATFRVYASPYTPRSGASAFQYDSAEDRFNPPETTPAWGRNVGTEASIVPRGVDIMMTHGPSKYLLDGTWDGASAGCEHLRRALARVRPRVHCFGHVHSGYGAVRVVYDDDGGGEVKGKEKVEEGEDGVRVVAREWVGRNQARRRGFAALSPGSSKDFRGDRGQTLVVNAAVEEEEGEEGGKVPWLVELEVQRVGEGMDGEIENVGICVADRE